MNQYNNHHSTLSWVPLRQLTAGTWFKKTENANKVYIRASYDSSIKRYHCDDWHNIGRDITLKGDKLVLIGFTF